MLLIHLLLAANLISSQVQLLTRNIKDLKEGKVLFQKTNLIEISKISLPLAILHVEESHLRCL